MDKVGFEVLNKQWHPTKNDKTIFDYKPMSDKKVWWKCNVADDHEWEAVIGSRTMGRGCPYCANKKVSKSNSLAAKHPELVKEWHPTKNNKGPEEYVYGSLHKVWWKCDVADDHEWETRIVRRTTYGNGCPYCVKREVSITNSLSDNYPEISKEWHPNKNKKSPKDFNGGSHAIVWWKCDVAYDHEWKSQINSRTQGRGCPYCVNKKVSKSNNLAAKYPEVAKEWHPTKNNKGPEEYVFGSNSKVWWKCDVAEDHEWETKIVVRTAMRRGCPYCTNNKLSVSKSLGILYPEISKQWHPTKNKKGPFEFAAQANVKVWWKCDVSDDHEWKALISSRTNFRGCPFCANIKVSTTNNLAAKYPEVAKEWHPTKNNKCPEEYVFGSNSKVWWKCDVAEDHEWATSIAARTGNAGTGCPYCSGRRVSVSNNLLNKYPEVAKEWHPTKNNKGPEEYVFGSNSKVWWKCLINSEHDWKAEIQNRTYNKSGCPYCILNNKSEVEIYISEELKLFFKLADQTKIKFSNWRNSNRNKIIDLDIIIPELDLIIEFDGSHYHNDRQEIDVYKSNKIIELGLNLIRIREKPLKKVSENDILVNRNLRATNSKQMKNVMNKLLKKIEQVCEIKIPKIDSYILDEFLHNSKQAKITVDRFKSLKS